MSGARGHHWKTWTPERVEEFAARFGNEPVKKLAAELGTSPGALYRRAREMGLHDRRATRPRRLDPNHAAIQHGRTRYPAAIATAETSPALFVSGSENTKVGNRVTKGRWKGLPIYTLTLVERETCPRSCLAWAICYGNNLNWSRRHRLDRDLIERMRWELTALNAKHRKGFVVRLHVLGDFGSDTKPALALAYAKAWLDWIERFPCLHVFGFTAWAPDSIVGKVVDRANTEFADRWRVRFSGRALAGRGALIVETEADSHHVVCPQETGKTESCGTCGLCWTMNRTVEFLRH